MASQTDIVNGYTEPTKWNDIIVYSDLVVRGNGQKSVNIGNTRASSKLFLMSPEMMTWGTNEATDPVSKDVKGYDFNMQFPIGEELKNNPDAQMFLNNLKSLEEKLKADAVKMSAKWFGRAMTYEQIDVIWTPMLRYPKNKETGVEDYNKSPSLRVKIPWYDSKFKAEFYNIKQEPIYLPDDDRFVDVDVPSLIQKLANVHVMAANGGLWFVGNKFGTTWRLQQVVVENKEIVSGRCMLPMSKGAPAAATAAPAAAKAPIATQVDDSDEEDEPAPAPEPAAEDEAEAKTTGVTVAKKKKVVKK